MDSTIFVIFYLKFNLPGVKYQLSRLKRLNKCCIFYLFLDKFKLDIIILLIFTRETIMAFGIVQNVFFFALASTRFTTSIPFLNLDFFRKHVSQSSKYIKIWSIVTLAYLSLTYFFKISLPPWPVSIWVEWITSNKSSVPTNINSVFFFDQLLK